MEHGRLFISMMATRHDLDLAREGLHMSLENRPCDEVIAELINTVRNLLYTLSLVEQLTPGVEEALNAAIKEYALELEKEDGR